MPTSNQFTVVVPPVTSSSGSHDNDNHDPNSIRESDEAVATGSNQETASWKPKFNRQQSWNSQDMKHEMQHRLLQTEKGKEPGYTEAATH